MSGIQPHNEKLATLWNAGGRLYDEISRGIADSLEHCVLRLNPKPGERILDLATGTGWTSRLVARRGAQVIGADLGPDLIAFATERAAEESLPITYQVADAESLPFADGEFDAVISTCGVMFAARPEAAAAELARVCRKCGRTVLSTWLADSNVFKMFMVMKPYMPPHQIRLLVRHSNGAIRGGSRTCWEGILTWLLKKVSRSTVSRPLKRRGRRFPTVMVRPKHSPPAWMETACVRCVAISSLSMSSFQHLSAYASLANT